MKANYNKRIIAVTSSLLMLGVLPCHAQGGLFGKKKQKRLEQTVELTKEQKDSVAFHKSLKDAEVHKGMICEMFFLNSFLHVRKYA